MRTAVSQFSDTSGLPRERRQSMEPDVYFKSPILSLLLKWCQAVCGYYDMKVGIMKIEYKFRLIS